MKKHFNKVLNWLIPNRRARLITKIMEQDQKLGLYDTTFNTKEK